MIDITITCSECGHESNTVFDTVREAIESLIYLGYDPPLCKECAPKD